LEKIAKTESKSEPSVATVVPEPAVRKMEPNRSKVSRIQIPAVEKTADLEPGDEDLFQPIVSTRAEIVHKYSEDEDVASPSEEGQGEKKAEIDPNAKAEDKSEKKVPKKFEGKSLEDVIASYTELEGLTTKLAQRNSLLEKGSSSPDTTIAKPVEKKLEISDALVEKFYSQPKEALADILSLATQTVEQSFEAKKKEESAKSVEQDQADTIAFVTKNRPDLIEGVNASMLDGIAAVTPGATYMERYTEAIKQLDKAMGTVAERTSQETKKKMAEVEKEKQGAALPSGSAADHSKGGKIWRRSEIDHLITKDPLSYVKQQKQIAKALQEGRVRED
jgi:hypothetical protein